MTIHCETGLVKHGNLGEAGFKRFSKGCLSPETGFPRGFSRVSKGPKSFRRVSNF